MEFKREDFLKKKGQVTIFIILAVVIVVAVIFLFFFLREPESSTTEEVSPKSFIQRCAEDLVIESVEIILKNGGKILPEQTIQYEGENYTYLCYQEDYYLPCYNLYPLLQEGIENEIKENSKGKVQNCFNLMKEDYESRGFSISGGATNFSINLFPNSIKINLEKDVEITDKDISQKFEDFSFEIASPLYELINIAREIVNSESQYCYFEYNGYMLLHPEYKIWRIDYDGTKIYKIVDRNTGKEFKFAERGCVSPPGI
ncbi:MAG: hypothetical protein WC494_02370 [Candidatus Pacearchaeota archaeon]